MFADFDIDVRRRIRDGGRLRTQRERRRPADERDDLWTVYNVLQENLIRGGVRYRSASGRELRSRGIRAIRDDVRINSRLWQAAVARSAA